MTTAQETQVSRGATALRTLAVQINEAHENARASVRAALDYAREAGSVLRHVKVRLKHGEFLPWVAEHTRLSARTAQGYMRVSREWPRLVASEDAHHVADLPLRKALALLAEPGADKPAADNETGPTIALLLDNHRGLVGLVRVLTWHKLAGPTRVRRGAARVLTECLSEMDNIGWGDDARALVTYCEAMPAFGRAEGEAEMSRLHAAQAEARIAELEGAAETKDGC